MAKVFISGSMKIKHLDKQVLERLNKIISSDLWIIVGDAEGVDSSVQHYLKQQRVDSVVVYCSGDTPRNNIGHWPTEKIRSESTPGTREYFRAKDLRMAEDCDYGLMVWDTKSTGTLSNTIELLKRGKSSLVFVNKAREFVKVKQVADLDILLGFMSSTAFKKADEKLNLASQLSALRNTQRELFGTR